MRLRTWATLLALEGCLVLFVGLLAPTVAPCLGLGPASNEPCIARWEAQRTVFDRLVEDLGLFPFLVLGLGSLLAVTVVADLVVRAARGRGRASRGNDAHADAAGPVS